MTTSFRKRVLDALTRELTASNDVFGIWEGGSAATKSADEFSDIDLNVLASDESTRRSRSWRRPKRNWRPSAGASLPLRLQPPQGNTERKRPSPARAPSASGGRLPPPARRA